MTSAESRSENGKITSCVSIFKPESCNSEPADLLKNCLHRRYVFVNLANFFEFLRVSSLVRNLLLTIFHGLTEPIQILFRN